ncbi:Wyosine [tRNA(Phe)-imidazoG37] synthetase, radical SAM superfamily [Andreprevotia lacus DSM 23236]|jgi:wyosine [tRNA(Phe)-imidazoG37] synthetase (radical SAM superfamily)|uniref:Wyosine [tRNA(Phe)-imidazoG37] synthetase, radical SAM superfamily n=1 Tax=Andreprevotia lacus DSM 23236 TaxID=1121001 RepID=A0A1W1XW16_9NEIS|nr:radical SAM protein [Andreprevotia lacus]SMC28180.1 Wyosine [tRNA(Phe)-imidazoG37] synthetase, radical SAM superfamily [Andreprevotia lacus DSM 23236]
MQVEGKTVQPLRVDNHDRDSAGFVYVYPVISRRAGGVSVGINLNPNNACNWRCLYCQVPDLQRGGPPAIDLAQLEAELTQMLDDIVLGDFMTRRVPEGTRRLNDIAFSGNGEPTMSDAFPEALAIVERAITRYQLAGKIKLVLISNGSQFYREPVQAAARLMATLGGEVWFKVDRAPVDGFSITNQINLKRDAVTRHLAAACAACPTWLQTCMFALDGALPTDAELDAYCDYLRELREQGILLRGVLLYGLARPSMQPEAARLQAAPADWMQALAQRIEALGYVVKLST